MNYKLPPKHAQFRKGKSGNPYGRPKRIDREFAETSAKFFQLVANSKSDNAKVRKIASTKLKQIKEILNDRK